MIKDKLQNLREKISSLAVSAGRDPKQIRLIAVSKKKSSAEILEAHDCGQVDFAENYAQELHSKATELQNQNLNWHFIGHLQKNKVKLVLPHMSLLHTLDSLELAEVIDNKAREFNKPLNALLQIKTAQEQSKTGCSPSDAEKFLKELSRFKFINMKGLMMISTHSENSDVILDEMRTTRHLLQELNAKNIYPTPLSELSMGMSQDYPLAIQEGATYLRIGSEIFGPRDS